MERVSGQSCDSSVHPSAPRPTPSSHRKWNVDAATQGRS
jgi:hypothetical protein